MKFRWPWSKKPESKRSYAASQVNRLMADWRTFATSADTEVRSSLPALRARSRQLHRDNDYARGANREFKNNIVGRGITLQAQVKKLRGSQLDDKLNQQIEEKWSDWCCADHCDVTGKLSFTAMQRLIIGSLEENGEVLVREIKQKFGDSKVPFALQILEADMLNDRYNDVSDEGNQIRMGVESDKWDRPIAYWFFLVHPGDIAFSSIVASNKQNMIRVLAEEVHHLYIPERIGQTRGVPWLVSAMIRLRHMGGLEEAEVIAARAGASLMGFIQTPDGELQGDGVEAEQRVTEFEPGVFKQLNPGEVVNVPNLNRPDGQFAPFMQAMLRGVAAGVGQSYETVSRDYSNTSYSSARTSIMAERDNYRTIQDWLIEHFNQPVFESWLEMAWLAGEIQLPQYLTQPEMYEKSAKWTPRGWAWIDPLKEVQAFGSAVDRGFMTQTDVIAQQGGDIEETLDTRQREIKMAKDRGLVFRFEIGEGQNLIDESDASAGDTQTSSQ